jgi:hypothetical protein
VYYTNKQGLIIKNNFDMNTKDKNIYKAGNNYKHSVSKRCDCFVGVFHDNNEKLYLSNVYEILAEHSRTTEMLFDHDLIKKPIMIKQYLDRRSGYMTFFNYCPYCGNKIKWKEIKSNCGV